ncbi:MAG: hypothetical protein L0154_15885 [Chloroflexi bacterium]|nr:hypothetical protein [Chloroflexota bacterium]
MRRVTMMTDHEFDLLTKQVEKLDYQHQLLLVERLVALIEQHERFSQTEDTWTAEELAELLKPQKALTGKEMVEQGFIGGWEDMGIEDGAEWVNQQKALRKAKRKKKLRW